MAESDERYEVVVVLKCDVSNHVELGRIVDTVKEIEGVTLTNGWLSIDDAAQQILAVVEGRNG